MSQIKEYYNSDDNLDSDDNVNSEEYTYEYVSATEDSDQPFLSIVNSDYKPPQLGTRQDNLTLYEIKKKLKGYIPLQTMREKRWIEKAPIFKTWVRYYNKKTGKFRVGGLLMKVEYPKYIMLVNTKKKLSWSVQLADNILFIRGKLIKREN